MTVDDASRHSQATGMQTRWLFIISVAASSVVCQALAHDTWLIADQMRVAPKATVTLDLTSGMAFPALDVAPKRESIPNASGRLAGRTLEVSDISAAPNSLQFKTELPEPGIAALWIKLPSRTLELKPEQVVMFNEEVNAPESLQKEWAEMPEPKRWRGTSTKHPRTFVRVGEPKGDTSWKEPVGLFLEIIPETDPTALRAGEDLPVRVLRDGAPHAGFRLNAVSAGEKEGETKTTDTAGRVTFKVVKAGRWLLRGVEARKSSAADMNFEAKSATLTFEVTEK